MNQYLSDILNHPVDKLALIDWPNMAIVDANEEFCLYVNKAKTDLLKSDFKNHIWPDVPREKSEFILNEVNTKGFVSLRDEEQRKIVQCTRIQCKDGLYALVRLFDIPTDEKNMESALKESERRFETFALSVTEGVAIVQDGVILDANDQLAKIYGKENHHMLKGKNLNELLGDSDIHRILASAGTAVLSQRIEIATLAVFHL